VEYSDLTCSSDGNIFYGVFGDTDGDDPEEIGEASWLMAQACFPSEGLNGGNGHTAADVTCEYSI
jgi:chitosanase